MCKWGDTVELLVPIPGTLSHTESHRWERKPIDRCIAPIIEALNAFGIYTASCCCGHYKQDGSILLQDGRELIVKSR